MKKIIMVLVIILAMSGMNAYAQCITTVSGDINGEIWNLAGSPYCVDGNVNVIDLTIQPNVTIEFMGDFDFSVSGRLVAAGAVDNLIQFKKAEGIAGWQGITILASSQNSEIGYCTISGYQNGGLKIYNSTPMIHHCHLTGNNEAESGTGLYVTLSTSSSDQFVIENSTISNNIKYGNGAGIYAELSAGSMVLRNCYVSNNTSSYTSTGTRQGAGIWTSANGGLKIENCEVSGNQTYSRCSATYCSVSTHGGGIYVDQGNAVLKNSSIRSNLAIASNSGYQSSSYAYGGGIFVQTGNLQCINSIISSNSLSANTSYYGGGIFNSLGTVDLTNCTVVANVAHGIATGTGATLVRNSIIYSNTTDQLYGTATVTYSDVQGGEDGEGNIDADPLFEDLFTYQTYCDYSPCTDAGSDYPWYNDSCFLPSCGTERNDMGAYGGPDACGWCAYGGHITLGPCEVPSLGDFNADGDVDASDLFLFSVNFGTE